MSRTPWVLCVVYFRIWYSPNYVRTAKRCGTVSWKDLLRFSTRIFGQKYRSMLWVGLCSLTNDSSSFSSFEIMLPKSFVWLEIIPWEPLALPVAQSLIHDEDFAVVSNWVAVKFFQLEARSLEERVLLWLNVFVKFDACAHWLRKRGLPSLSIRFTFSSDQQL